MSTSVDTGPDLAPEGDMVITLDVGRSGLDRYLKLLGGRRGPRIKCLDGSLTLVSPSHRHERGGRRVDQAVSIPCEELDIDYRGASSTLLRPPGLEDTGIEPDHCYYIDHEADVRAAGDQLDLGAFPPPDLLVEVVVTHGPAKALAICLLLGIPEVWIYRPRSGKLQFLHLDAGRYEARDRSRAFPFLSPTDLLPWLDAPADEPDNRWRRRFRDWVRDELGPRRAGG